MSAAIVRLVQRLVRPLQRRVMLTVGRGVLAVIDDARLLQTLQVSLLADEVRDGVEHFQPYGLASAPIPGAECVFLSVAGSRDHGVVVVVSDRRHRPLALEQGEAALYTDEGVGVRLARGGDVHVGAREVETYAARADRVDARFAALEASVSALVTLFNAHVHLGSGVATATPATPPNAGASTAADKVRIL